MTKLMAAILSLSVVIGMILIITGISYIGKRYGQKLVNKRIITVEEFYEVGYIGWFFYNDFWNMKKILISLLMMVTLTGCKTTYYMYYEVESPEDATSVSRIDGNLARNRKSPTRCVQSYVDSTGHRVYLMETKSKE